MPSNVLANDEVSPQTGATRSPSFTVRCGFRVRRTPFSVVQAPSTRAASTTFGAPSQGRQWARNFHPCRVRFGRLTTVPHWVATVTPVAPIETRRRTDAGTLAVPDCAIANCPEQVGAAIFFAAAGAAATAATSAASERTSQARACMAPSIAHSGRARRAVSVSPGTDPVRTTEALSVRRDGYAAAGPRGRR